jgi:hypothetical protein
METSGLLHSCFYTFWNGMEFFLTKAIVNLINKNN